MRKLATILAAFSALASVPAAAQIEQAEVTGGTVAGTVEGGLSVFRGIPFAAPPTGDLRWKAPQPVVPWWGVRQADRFAPACMQSEATLRQYGSSAPMSEDCLYLDVWTPADTPDEKLPVIVWLYGGGFNSGATSVGLYDGANFAEQGVVFVALSYRLGAFGFLASSDLSAESGQGSANYAALDWIAGLEWVRDNVAKFGGDPERVTIMGHSAGSTAVSMLAASPLSEGLFDGIIAESGADFGPAQSEPFAGGGPYRLAWLEQQGDAWLRGLGANTLDQARAIPAGDLVAAQSAQGAPPWRSAIDGYFLTDDQYDLWTRGEFMDVPLLVGTASNEWGASGNVSNEGFAERVRRDYGAFADRVLAAYAGDLGAMWLGNEIGMNAVANEWARLHTTNGTSPVYYYWFDNAPGGSGHGSEVALVFANEDLRPGRTGWDERTRALSRQLQSYWVNFAKTGNPNGAGLPQWPQYDPADPQVMALGLESGPRDVPGGERLQVLADYFAWRRGQGQ